MTRSFFAVVSTLTFGLALAPAFLEGCKASGIGDPCVPEQEYDPTFNGFSVKEVNVESKSFQCQTRLCLVNHFQGRVSCPYGQSKDGHAPTSDTDVCAIPGATFQTTASDHGYLPVNAADQVTGNPQDPKNLALVPPQCSDRNADLTVYCSCRCQNVNGKTDDGANYCQCPDGYKCEQLVTSLGAGTGNEGLTGGFCVKNVKGSVYDTSTGGGCTSTCDPTTNATCGPKHKS